MACRLLGGTATARLSAGDFRYDTRYDALPPGATVRNPIYGYVSSTYANGQITVDPYTTITRMPFLLGGVANIVAHEERHHHDPISLFNDPIGGPGPAYWMGNFCEEGGVGENYPTQTPR